MHILIKIVFGTVLTLVLLLASGIAWFADEIASAASRLSEQLFETKREGPYA